MGATERINGFFSYACVDWKADTVELAHLFDLLETQTRAAGIRGFAKWLDRERLHWGDDWQEALLEAIAESHLFFVFLSPGWLASKVCRQEFEAFRARQDQLGGKRVFVAHIRDLDDHERAEHAEILAELDRLQAKQWQTLLTGDERARKVACATAAREIKARLRSLVASPVAPVLMPPTQCAVVPPVCGQKLASGDFYIPLLSQGGEVDGSVQIYLRLLFSGWAKVTTKHGRFVFGATSARLHVQVAGGRMLPHPEFAKASRPAEVVPTGGGHDHGFYQITTSPGPLRGNVLTDADDHVPMLRVERHDGATVNISGTIELNADGLVVDSERSAPKRRANPDGDADKIERMRQRIAAVILEEHGSRFTLEGAES